MPVLFPVLILAFITVLSGAVAWTAYLLHVGLLDARDLAEKVSTHRPVSVLDWPEFRIDGVLEPDSDGVVLVSARWPAHPDKHNVVVLRLTQPDSVRRLSAWYAAEARVSTHQGETLTEFRRRHSVQRIKAAVLDEHPV
jgi:hypothetical protein